jgi:hypothetical protein
MTGSTTPPLLSAVECRQNANECARLALEIDNLEHRAMLEQMAETWLRIAADVGRIILG